MFVSQSELERELIQVGGEVKRILEELEGEKP